MVLTHYFNSFLLQPFLLIAGVSTHHYLSSSHYQQSNATMYKSVGSREPHFAKFPPKVEGPSELHSEIPA